MKLPRNTLVLLSLCTMMSCSGARPVETQVMLNHQNCQTLQPGITPVSIERIAQIRGSRLLSLESAQRSTTSATPSMPDSEGQPRASLFAISKGPMPTPGYGMDLVSAQLQGQIITVQVQWQQPAEGTVQAQMITHPCLVIGLPTTDAHTLIVMEADKELARISL